MIALGVAVHAADALIVAADQARQLALEIDLGAAQQQVGRRGEMRFVGPFGTRQRARQQAFADVRDLSVGGEQSRSVFGHRSGPWMARSATGPC